MVENFESSSPTQQNLEKIPYVIQQARKSGMLSSDDFKTIKNLTKAKFKTFMVTTPQLKEYGTSVGELNILVTNWWQQNR